MRVSSGVDVTDLCGKMRMKRRPSGAPRTAATRQASITFAGIHAGVSDWRPHSPKDTSFPRCATPRMRPRWDFLNFTRFGIVAMSDGLLARGLRRRDRAGVDPALDADRPVRGLRRGRAVVDGGLERREGDRAADLL